jgi:cell division protein FtsX
VGYEIPIEGTLQILTSYAWLVALTMIGIGAVIGIVSAYIATRKYLKI